MINLLILTLIVLATSVVNAFIDNYLIKKKWGKVKNLNHTSRTFIRVTIFWISIYFIFPYSLLNLILTSAYSVLLFNVTFDPLLNKLRTLPWYYDGKDAITDKLSGHFGSDANEPLAYIELGIKSLLIIGLAIWIIFI
jgi:hypothetical protein